MAPWKASAKAPTMSVALNLTRWTSCTASLESHSTRYAVTRAPPSSTGGVHVTFSDPSPSGLMATVRGGDGAAAGVSDAGVACAGRP